jgi:hypothetical protein
MLQLPPQALSWSVRRLTFRPDQHALLMRSTCQRNAPVQHSLSVEVQHSFSRKLRSPHPHRTSPESPSRYMTAPPALILLDQNGYLCHHLFVPRLASDLRAPLLLALLPFDLQQWWPMVSPQGQHWKWAEVLTHHVDIRRAEQRIQAKLVDCISDATTNTTPISPKKGSSPR